MHVGIEYSLKMMEIGMISYLAMPLLLANLSGCDLIAQGRQKIEDVKDKIEGLTNPLVADGVILSFDSTERRDRLFEHAIFPGDDHHHRFSGCEKCRRSCERTNLGCCRHGSR